MKTDTLERIHEFGESLKRTGEIMEEIMPLLPRMEEFKSLMEKMECIEPPGEEEMELIMERKGMMDLFKISHAFEQMESLSKFEDPFSVPGEEQKEFIENIDQNVLTKIVLDNFDNAVINHRYGSSRSRTNGLSIFFPDGISPYSLSKIYNNKALYGTQAVGENLDFTIETYWNEFLILFVMSNIFFGDLYT